MRKEIRRFKFLKCFKIHEIIIHERKNLEKIVETCKLRFGFEFIAIAIKRNWKLEKSKSHSNLKGLSYAIKKYRELFSRRNH